MFKFFKNMISNCLDNIHFRLVTTQAESDASSDAAWQMGITHDMKRAVVAFTLIVN